jgi:multidrug efflux pump subunit AcrA (membrane-fusion protein)
MKSILWPISILLLVACGRSPEDTVEMVDVGNGLFEIILHADGELVAAESTPIKPPPGSRNPRTIEWMVPDNSWVTKDQVVARFDASVAQRGTEEIGIELSKVDIQVMAKQRELERLLGELGNEMDLVDVEKLMADTFTFDNELAYSRHEIIDAMRDRELLDYRFGHLEGKQDTYRDRQGAEEAVLTAARKTQESKYQEHKSQLDNSEILAPHDGFFVYEKTWFRQKVDIGSTVFPGNKIATIPNLEKMNAKLDVLETEAVGISKGQSVRLTIDAFPDRPLTGKVINVSATASPIARDVPVKFFTVTVALDDADPKWIKPESKVSAVIAIDRIENAIYVPNQAIFSDANGDWVLVEDGAELVKREIQLGLRGANRSQVVGGLEKDDRIALFPPTQNGSKEQRT